MSLFPMSPHIPPEATSDLIENMTLIDDHRLDVEWLFWHENWVYKWVGKGLDREIVFKTAIELMKEVVPVMMMGDHYKEWVGIITTAFNQAVTLRSPEDAFEALKEWANSAYLYGKVERGDDFMADAQAKLAGVYQKPERKAYLKLVMKLIELRKYSYDASNVATLSDDLQEISLLLQNYGDDLMYTLFYQSVAQYLRQTEQHVTAFEYQQMALIYSWYIKRRPLILARSLMGLAQSYRVLDKLEMIDDLYSLMERTIPREHYRLGYIVKELDLGSIAMKNFEWQQGYELYKSAGDAAALLEADYYLHLAYFGMGVCLTHIKGKMDDAYKALWTAHQYWSGKSYPQDAIRTIHALGHYYFHRGDQLLARFMFEDALRRCKAVQNVNMQALEVMEQELIEAIRTLDNGTYGQGVP